MEDLIALPLGFLLDQLVGDPPGWPHPVRWIGRLVLVLEPPLRRWFPERLAGVVLLMVITGLTAGSIWAGLFLAGLVHWGLRLGVATVMIYYGLAARSLARETGAVLGPCAQQDWPAARLRLSYIVGRDTQELPPEEIYRACIETVAENTTDGVVAPLFYAALLGPAGMWAYKAINTLDSMVGYRQPRYLRFGWASARADDLANYVPARLAFLLLSLAAWLTRHQAAEALRVGWRDGRKHPSPNAGWAEAAMAGALGLQLGGASTYGGVRSEKPLLGQGAEALTLGKVRQALGVMMIAAWLALGLSWGIVVVRWVLLAGNSP